MIKNELSLAYKAPEIKTVSVEVRRCMMLSPNEAEAYGYSYSGKAGYSESDNEY